MTYQIRIYAHHDNDLIQLHLNGIRLAPMIKKALTAHYRRQPIRFEFPDNMEFKANKGRICRIHVTFDDEKEKDIIEWIDSFPSRYKNHCIKNILRAYVGTFIVDSMNMKFQTGEWKPAGEDAKVQEIPADRMPEKKENTQTGSEWVDEIGRENRNRKDITKDIDELKEAIYHRSIEELLGTGKAGSGTDTAEGSISLPQETQGYGVTGVPGNPDISVSGDDSRSATDGTGYGFHDADPGEAGNGETSSPITGSDTADDNITQEDDENEYDEFDAFDMFNAMHDD